MSSVAGGRTETRPGPVVRPVLVTAAAGVAALCDLPAQVRVGDLSGSAVVSAGLAALGFVFAGTLVSYRRWANVRPFLPFVVFFCWAVYTTALKGVDLAALQTLSVLCLFVAVGMTAARALGPADVDVYRRALTAAGWCIALLYAAGIALDGLDSQAIVGPRSFALEALVLMAMAVPYARSGDRAIRALPPVLLVLIAASLSRTATVLALVLLAVYVAYGRERKAARLGLVLTAGIAALYWAVTNLPQVRERFTGGDRAFEVAGFTVSLQGRATLWELVLLGARDEPVVGHGPGSVREHIATFVPGQTEPHNDFLRVLYETGWIGLALFVWACVALLVAVARRARRAPGSSAAAPHVGALLALLVTLVGFLTDNALVYSFVMAPLAVVVGMSLALPVAPQARRVSFAAERIPVGPGTYP